MSSRRKSCCGSHVFVRSMHTALTVGVLATLLFQDTRLSQAFHNGTAGEWMYTIGFLLLINLSLVLYWVTCLMDPGFVPLKRQHRYDDSDEEAGEGMMSSTAHMLNNGVKLRRCGFCGIDQPLRTRHCEDCDRCVRKFDHHCPWLETCVGERNHKFFWLFLTTKCAVIVWAFYIVWHAFIHKPDWTQWLKSNILFLLDALTLVTSGFVVLALWGIHSYLMVTNTTTWEAMSRQRITYLKRVHYDYNPFHEGYIMNTVRFLCQWGIVKWESVYNKRVDRLSKEEMMECGEEEQGDRSRRREEEEEEESA